MENTLCLSTISKTDQVDGWDGDPDAASQQFPEFSFTTVARCKDECAKLESCKAINWRRFGIASFNCFPVVVWKNGDTSSQDDFVPNNDWDCSIVKLGTRSNGCSSDDSSTTTTTVSSTTTVTSTTATTKTTTTKTSRDEPNERIIMSLSSFSNEWGTATKSLDDGSGNSTWTGRVHKSVTIGQGQLEGSKAFEFDGVGRTPKEGQHISIDGGTTIGGRALTICVKVKYMSFGQNSRIVDFGPAAGGDILDDIYWGNEAQTSKMAWHVMRGDESENFSVDNFWEIGVWIHACVSVDNSGTMRAFKNGVEMECTGGSACSGAVGTNGVLPNRLLRPSSYIGRSNWYNDQYFHGSMSDLVIMDGYGVATDAGATNIMKTNTVQTITTVFADLDGTTASYDTYWGMQCKNIPDNTLFIVAKMGTVRDYFKPHDGTTYCEMLQTYYLHLWSNDGINWVLPTYNGAGSTLRGMSAINWPLNNVDGDSRRYLTAWGGAREDGVPIFGGCCSNSYSTSDNPAWGLPFTMSYVVYDPAKKTDATTIATTSTPTSITSSDCENPKYAALDETTASTGPTCENVGLSTISDESECRAAAEANGLMYEVMNQEQERPFGCHTTAASLGKWFFNRQENTNDVDHADRLVCKSCSGRAATTTTTTTTTTTFTTTITSTTLTATTTTTTTTLTATTTTTTTLRACVDPVHNCQCPAWKVAEGDCGGAHGCYFAPTEETCRGDNDIWRGTTTDWIVGSWFNVQPEGSQNDDDTAAKGKSAKGIDGDDTERSGGADDGEDTRVVEVSAATIASGATAAAASMLNATAEDAISLIENGVLGSIAESIEAVVNAPDLNNLAEMDSGADNGQRLCESVEKFANTLVSKLLEGSWSGVDATLGTNEGNLVQITWETAKPTEDMPGGDSALQAIDVSFGSIQASIPVPMVTQSSSSSNRPPPVAAAVIIYYAQTNETNELFPTDSGSVGEEGAGVGNAAAAAGSAFSTLEQLASPVVSISLAGSKMDEGARTAAGNDGSKMVMTEGANMTMTFETKVMEYGDEGDDGSSASKDGGEWVCVWWDWAKARSADSSAGADQLARLGAWSREGCAATSVAGSEDVGELAGAALVSRAASVTCSCNHMTHFAVLFSVKIRTDAQEELLEYLSYIGAAVGLVGLLFIWLTFAVSRDLMGRPEYIILNLSIAIAVGLILFVAGSDRKDGQSNASCKAVAGALHYFLLASWFWQLCEAGHLYNRFIRVLGKDHTMRSYALVGWVAPLLFVLPSYVAFGDDYGNDKVCFIAPQSQANYLFIVPAFLCLFINFVVGGYLVKAVGAATKSNRSRACAVLTFGSTLGLAYGFAALLMTTGKFVFEVLFCIFAGLQGMFIFYLHVYRKDHFKERLRITLMGGEGTQSTLNFSSRRATRVNNDTITSTMNPTFVGNGGSAASAAAAAETSKDVGGDDQRHSTTDGDQHHRRSFPAHETLAPVRRAQRSRRGSIILMLEHGRQMQQTPDVWSPEPRNGSMVL